MRQLLVLLGGGNMTTVVDSMTVFAAKNTCVLTVKQSWENVCEKETYCKNQPDYLVCL